MDATQIKWTICLFFGLIYLVHACDEPALCQKNAHFCATREKFRTKCPCTCAPDINFAKCCAAQTFKHEKCRQVCSYDPANEAKYKTMAALCYSDFFKVLYCSSNGHSNSTECCLKNGVSKDLPGKAGCSIFCEVKPPQCSRAIEYLKCSQGQQFLKSQMCARQNYDKPRWKANVDANCAA